MVKTRENSFSLHCYSRSVTTTDIVRVLFGYEQVLNHSYDLLDGRVVCTDQAAALLAAVQPGRSAGVEGASALVQALTAGPVVAARTAEEVLVWVPAIAASPSAVCVAVLHSRGH